MNLGDVIRKADALYPNHFSLTEKLDWCSEVSAYLRNEIDLQFDFVRVHKSDIKRAVNEIGELYVKSVITDTHIYTITEVLKWYQNGIPAEITGEVRILFLTIPKPYRATIFSGNGEIKNNIIELRNRTEFEKGDTVSIVFEGMEYTGKIDDGHISYHIAGCTIPDYMGELVMKKHIDDALECSPPYDMMYVDYVLGKMCYYQHDYDTYNQHMAQYNNKIMLYQKWVKTRKKYSVEDNFHNFWS